MTAEPIIKKKRNKKVKEFLNSVRENDEEEETGLNTANSSTEAIELLTFMRK